MDKKKYSIEERELFLGMLAHDIRQPLFLIKTHAQMAMNSAIKPDVQSHLAKILAVSRRMERMMRDFLDYTKDASPEDPATLLHLEEIDIHELFTGVLEEVRISFPGTQIQMKIEGDGVGCWDRERLYQIISNLVQNAIVHGSSDQPIRIHSYPVSRDQHCVEIFNKGEKIPHDKLNEIFLPFKTRIHGGTGLGLYITKYLVEAHGGSIQVTSEQEGTTFKVCLPVRPRGP